MSEPSQIAVECVRELFSTTPMSDKPGWCEIVQSAIDKALAEKEVEIEDLKQQRNMAAIQERRKYLPKLARMREALTGVLDRYVGLVNSGDAGNWDPETEDVVIKARAALDIPARPEPAAKAEVKR